MLEKFRRFKAFTIKYSNVIFFVGGFLFDSLTLVRIDSKLDLMIQIFYLLMLVFLIVLKTRFDQGLWTPPARLQKLWEFESEATHFFYGGLLSAYVIFYFKSTTLSRSVFFLGLVFILMFANEMPQVRRFGATLRLGLYSFCLVSFLNYFLPVLIGRMNGFIFALAWLLSLGITGALVNLLAKTTPDPARSRWRWGWPPTIVLLVVASLYVLKLIPPVPLSMQYAGIYQQVAREGDRFKLTYQKPPWYAFWRSDNRQFLARPGDQIFCFTRVFAPRKFTHQIFVTWSKKDEMSGEWISSDRIPLSISGGRDDGFRGFASKANYEPGTWMVEIQTQDGRALGGVKFTVEADASLDERKWVETWM